VAPTPDARCEHDHRDDRRSAERRVLDPGERAGEHAGEDELLRPARLREAHHVRSRHRDDESASGLDEGRRQEPEGEGLSEEHGCRE
jgi:hypothetical protein